MLPFIGAIGAAVLSKVSGSGAMTPTQKLDLAASSRNVAYLQAASTNWPNAADRAYAAKLLASLQAGNPPPPPPVVEPTKLPASTEGTADNRTQQTNGGTAGVPVWAWILGGLLVAGAAFYVIRSVR